MEPVRRVALLCGLVAALAPGSPAGAESSGSPEYGRIGGYAGVGGMAQISVGTRSEKSFGFGELLVGYRFARGFGLDLDVQAGSASIVKVVGQAKAYPVGNWPIQPYFLLGVGTWIFPDRGGAVGLLRPGIGVDLYVSEQWLVAPTLYYEMIFSSGGVASSDAVNFGATLQYRF
jgi:hypothetical protein